MATLDLLTELTHTSLDPALIAAVRALTEQSEASQQRLLILDNDLRAQDANIAALTFELATLRRIRFGKKSEALRGPQQGLFEETVDADLAAIEAELVQQQTPLARAPQTTKTPRSRAGRQPLPPELPRLDPRHEPDSCQCAFAVKTGRGCAKTSASNSMLNPPVSLSTVLFALNMPAAKAKASWPRP
jgi:hypothetical protein